MEVELAMVHSQRHKPNESLRDHARQCTHTSTAARPPNPPYAYTPMHQLTPLISCKVCPLVLLRKLNTTCEQAVAFAGDNKCHSVSALVLGSAASLYVSCTEVVHMHTHSRFIIIQITGTDTNTYRDGHSHISTFIYIPSRVVGQPKGS